MVIRRLTYRLYPNKNASGQLHWARRMHCCLYNAAVANRKTQYQKLGHSVDYFEQQNCLPKFKEVWTEYKKLGSHSLQATLKRVDLAFARFFKKLGKYPKFKSSRCYRGWTYPCKSGWKVSSNNGVNGDLELRDLGIVVQMFIGPSPNIFQMRGKARTWGIPKTCTSDRVHICSECGHIAERDINSAQVCLTWAWGQELSSLDVESPRSTSKTRKHTGSLKQLGALKRQKPQPQP